MRCAIISVHNYRWMDRPIIQTPTDLYALQEIIWDTRPDLIIETGIAHGGSLIFNASMLAMLEYTDAIQSGSTLNPSQPKRKVLGIDIDIRAHNRTAIEAHPMFAHLELMEGSSIEGTMIEQVTTRAAQAEKVMVILDSNHTHDHVLAELEAYAPLVSKGCYCIVMDTGVEYLPDDMVTNRPWGKGNNPKTAVDAYLKTTDMFEINSTIEHKIMLTAAYGGFLRRVR